MGARAVIGGLLAIAAIVAIALPGGASGDDASKPYPTRQVKIMAPAAPGGGWDTTARAFQAASRDAKLDDGIEVYNVEGAGGTLGLSELVSRRPRRSCSRRSRSSTCSPGRSCSRRTASWCGR